MLPALSQNRAIAAGNLTVTPERLLQVYFTNPVLRGINEVVVTRDTVPELDSTALSGRTVVTRRVSSYHASLLALNEQLAAVGKPPSSSVWCRTSWKPRT